MGGSPCTRTIAARFVRGSIALCVLGALSGTTFAAITPADVVTYHNDVNRSGWNPHETQLTPATVKQSFVRVKTVALDGDDQVDAQPLVVGSQLIEGMGEHAVVYLATENDTVYAIDAHTGDILKKRSLGTPVPRPFGCSNGGNFVGINGTPTIDKDNLTLYVLAYVLQAGTPTYELHALALDTLQDNPGSPVTAQASGTLSDGSTLRFDARYERQRPALLDANGRIYAAFGSFCDFKAGESRGWVLGWDKGNLASQPIAALSDKLPQSTATTKCTYQNELGESPCFLSSIWMSGFGLSTDAQGSIYFTTGNSASGTYDGSSNVSESLVKLNRDLSLAQVFSPSNLDDLDAHDNDFGSGGVLVLPEGSVPGEHLVLAGGKDGRLFIVDSDHLGGHQLQDAHTHADIGHCFCGPSVYQTAEGPRVVSSGENQLQTWSVATVDQLHPTLTHIATAPPMEKGQSDGFFTSISSDGTTPNTAIIWALSRPINQATGIKHHITLYAYGVDGPDQQLSLLWSGIAGTWTFGGSGCCHANLVPTIANGFVYVASENQLEIFTSPPPTLAAVYRLPIALAKTSDIYSSPVLHRALVHEPGARYWGEVSRTKGNQLWLRLRDGTRLVVDITAAVKNETAKVPRVGGFASVSGDLNPKTHQLKASRVNEVLKDPADWGRDQAR
jgi:hypothetical protein